MKNPHNYLSKVCHPGVGVSCADFEPHDPVWECQYCGEVGTTDALRTDACSYVYPPCKHCGQTPECALDCKGVWAALSRPGVVVIA